MLRLFLFLAAAGLADPAWAQTAETAHALTGATDTFLQQGILGAVIVVEACVVALLYWDCRQLRTQLADVARERIAEVKDLATETADGLATSKSTMATLTLEVAALSNKVQSSIDVARLQPAALDAIVKQGQEHTRDLDRYLSKIEQIRDMVSSGGAR